MAPPYVHTMATPDTAPRSAYVDDIRRQPDTLARVLDAGLDGEVSALVGDLGGFSRIVLTGMGASLHALYPTYRRMAAAGLPVSVHETAELLSLADGVLTDGCLLWVLSQSGASAEVVALLDAVPRSRRTTLLATTNDPAGPLARGAHVVMEIHSGQESTVGTGSYVNSLAALALACGHAVGADTAPLRDAPAALAAYLAGWEAHIEDLDRLLPDVPTFVLGRGSSLAAAWTGALISKEAAGRAVEAMSVPQFRHGPLEMAGPDVATVILAGTPDDQVLNRRMHDDLVGFGARALWLAPRSTGPAMPDLSGTALPLAEVVPLQAMSVLFARRAGRVPGEFHRIGKVTRQL